MDSIKNCSNLVNLCSLQRNIIKELLRATFRLWITIFTCLLWLLFCRILMMWRCFSCGKSEQKSGTERGGQRERVREREKRERGMAKKNRELKILRWKYDSKNNLIDAIRSVNCKPQLTFVSFFNTLSRLEMRENHVSWCNSNCVVCYGEMCFRSIAAWSITSVVRSV